MIVNLVIFLLNATLQALVLFLVGVIAARTLRKTTPSLENLLWSGLLVAATLIPFLSLTGFRNSTAPLHPWAWRSKTVIDFGLWLAGGSNSTPDLSFSPLPRWHSVLLAFTWVYGLFVVFQLTRFLHGWLQVRQIVAASSPCRDARVRRVFSICLPRFPEGRTAIRVSETARVPFATGFHKPVIILPRFLVSDSHDDELAVVLAHELAHVCRNDWLVNMVLLLLSMPFSFNPFIALMRKKVEASREAACDEYAASCMASPHAYARGLLDLANKLARHQPSLLAANKGAALGVLDGSKLEDRIRRLMDRSPRLTTKQSRLVLCACIGGLLATCMAVASFALAPPSATNKAGSVAGVWTGQFTDRHGPNGKIGHTPIYLKLQESGAELTGVIGPDASAAFPIQNAELQDSRLHLTTISKQGDVSVNWSLDLTVNGKEMSGTGHAVRNDNHAWDVEVNLTRK